MELNVEIAADPKDPKAGAAPRSLRFDGRSVSVADVVDRWAEAEGEYFKVRDAPGNTYILRHDGPRGMWELIMFVSKHGTAVDDLLGKAVSPRSRRTGDGRL